MPQSTQAVQTAIPFKRDAPTGNQGVSLPGVVIVVVSLVVIGALLAARKRLRIGQVVAGRRKLVRVLETHRIGPRGSVSVVEYNGHQYLVAQGEYGISCIASTSAREAV